jgi:hypothetical protein
VQEGDFYKEGRKTRKEGEIQTRTDGGKILNRRKRRELRGTLTTEAQRHRAKRSLEPIWGSRRRLTTDGHELTRMGKELEPEKTEGGERINHRATEAQSRPDL